MSPVTVAPCFCSGNIPHSRDIMFLEYAILDYVIEVNPIMKFLGSGPGSSTVIGMHCVPLSGSPHLISGTRHTDSELLL